MRRRHPEQSSSLRGRTVDEAEVTSPLPLAAGDAQLLIRRVATPAGVRGGASRRPWYEVAYFPQGRGEMPDVDATSPHPLAELPFRIHPTDQADIMNTADRAADDGDDRFVAWWA